MELKSNVFVSDGYTAQEFMEVTIKNRDDIVANIDELKKGIISQNYTVNRTVLNIIGMFLKDDIKGLIPCISITNDIEDFNYTQEIFSDNFINKTYSFICVGIIKDMKMVDKIYQESVETYNLIVGNAEDIALLTQISEQDKIILNCTKEDYSLKINTKEDKISEIIISLNFVSSIEEAHSKKDIFEYETISKIEQTASDELNKRITELIEKEIKSEIDYMEFAQKFERQHPYIYRKIKKEFKEKIKEAKIVPNVKVSVTNSFDVTYSNKYQKKGD